MSCSQREALYRYPWPGQTEPDRVALRAHVKECPECAATVVRLESARRALLTDAPQFEPFRQSATWHAIDAQVSLRDTPWYRRPALVSGALLTLAALFLFVAWPGGPEGYRLAQGRVTSAGQTVQGVMPVAHGLMVEQTATIEGPQLRLVAEAGTTLSLELDEWVRVSQGQVHFEVAARAATTPFTVVTPHARIQGLGSQFRVQVSDLTQVEVTSGRVEVRPQDAPALELGPGQTWASLSPRNEIQRARAMVGEDAVEAGRVAQAALTRARDAVDQVDALAVIADAHRRSGQLAEAARVYGRIAAHPAGQAYAEEALLRRARVLLSLKDGNGALDAVNEAQRRFPNGTLAPERCAVQARIWLHLDQPARAADVLLGCPSETLGVQEILQDTARALTGHDPARAQDLLRRLEK